MKLERELMRGAGPMAVLQLLSGGEKYGYELVESLNRQTDGVLKLGQSTLYPMLYNLEAKGIVASKEKAGSNGRQRRYYRFCLLYTSPSPRDGLLSRMPSSA